MRRQVNRLCANSSDNIQYISIMRSSPYQTAAEVENLNPYKTAAIVAKVHFDALLCKTSISVHNIYTLEYSSEVTIKYYPGVWRNSAQLFVLFITFSLKVQLLSYTW